MLNCRFYRVLYSTGLRFAVTLVVRAGHASADVSAMASLVSEQFQRATVDFYSALGEGELGIAAQVGAAMRAMVCDRVLDSVEDEMARDCLAVQPFIHRGWQTNKPVLATGRRTRGDRPLDAT